MFKNILGEYMKTQKIIMKKISKNKDISDNRP